jgi:hypothetical protein
MQWCVALYGAPFAIVFDPQNPSAGTDPLQASPFETISDRLGFAHNRFSGPDARSAFDTTHQALLQGHPIIVRHGSPPTWVIVTGYDLREERVHFMPPGRGSYAASDRKQFLAGWSTGAGGGSGVAGAEPFYQFSLAARLRKPSEPELMQSVLKRAAEVMQRRTLSGAPAGTAAWQSAGTWLERCIDPAEADAREAAAGWAGGSLRPWLKMAQTVTPVLQKVEAADQGLKNAAQRHTELLQEAELVARKIDEATVAEAEAATKWQAAAAQANYVAALHQRLTEQFVAAANGG